MDNHSDLQLFCCLLDQDFQAAESYQEPLISVTRDRLTLGHLLSRNRFTLNLRDVQCPDVGERLPQARMSWVGLWEDQGFKQNKCALHLPSANSTWNLARGSHCKRFCRSCSWAEIVRLLK